MVKMLKIDIPDGMDPEAFHAGFKAALDMVGELMEIDEEEEAPKTCEGCQYKATADGEKYICVRSLMFPDKGTAVLKAVTAETERCEHYEEAN